MKNVKLPDNPVSVATLLICGLFLFITSMKCNSGTAKPTDSSVASFDKNSRALTHTIKLDKYGSILKSLGQDQLVLELYPVKRSTDAAKQDFDLVIVPYDKKGKPLGGQAADRLPENNSLNFLQFARQQQIPASDVSPGYQVVLDAAKLSIYSTLQLKIGFAGALQSMAYVSGGQQTMSADSVPICKCPPGCPQITGKCVFELQMATLIKQVYQLQEK